MAPSRQPMRLRKAPLTAAACLALAAVISQVVHGRAQEDPVTRVFGHPEPVNIRGYSGISMEPFVSRDGKFLFFNNSNDPKTDTNLFYATRIDDLTWQFKGEVKGVNTPALEGVATMDRTGNFYFISTRSYPQTFSTIYHGTFKDGTVSNIAIVPGISDKRAGRVNFDVEVSADGNSLYYVESTFSGGQPQEAKLEVAHRVGNSDSFVRDPDSEKIMANVNASKLQYAACISNDQKTLFFTRLRMSALPPTTSIYMATRPDAHSAFRAPVRIVSADGFVEGPTLSPDEKSLYYHKKVGSGFEIYRVTRQ